MKIEFNEQELEFLTKLVFLADFIVDLGSDDLEEEIYNNFRDIIDKIYLAVSKSSLHDMVEPIAEDEYEASEDLLADADLNTIIENYENISFWDRLVEMLAMRDIVEKMPWEEYSQLKPTKRAEIINAHFKKYFQEFEIHGVDRLRIVE